MKAVIPSEVIEQRIFLIRGDKVMIDRDLAELYDVHTKALNQAVKRNTERFPEGFMFRITKEERTVLVTNCDRFRTLRHSTSLPYAFTELGVAMPSSVLKSKRAIQVNIHIMKTFVHLRRMFTENKELSQRLEELEKKYDKQFKVVFDILNQLINPSEPEKRKMGFLVKEKAAVYSVKKKKVYKYGRAK
ncbi:MAG: ORF6N domain-containing protein [Ignavibacteria bacterium]|nr:ORF6N domain-containing protein [Ignavibacteria bacterium]